MSCHHCYVILALILVVAIRARLDDDREEEERPASSIYLVLVHGEPLAASPWREELGQNASSSSSYHAARRRVVRLHDRLLRRTTIGGAAGSLCRKIYSFHHAVNGFAVHATPAQAERLSAAPEVAAVEEDRGTTLMTTYTPRLLGLPDGVWPCRDGGGGEGNDGEGMVVGVVDTGVDPTHPSFAYVPRTSPPPPPSRPGRRRPERPPPVVCGAGPRFPPGSCNGKILTARYFAEGAAAAAIPLDASRDLSPFDADGHGRLAVYKAIYPAGGTMADLISAIDQATQDEVDVLVLSVGPDERPASKVTFVSMLDVALLFARKAGVFVVQAAGNRGPADSSVVSYSPWVTTVAADTTGRSYTPRLVLGDGRRVSGFGLSAPTPGGDGQLRFRLVAARDAAAPEVDDMERAEECQDVRALRRRGADVLRGSIVICSFSEGLYNGTSTVTAIVDTAEALGFAGFVLVANARYGDFVAQPLPFSVPGVMVPRVADAQVVWSYYAEHTLYAGNATVFGATAEITEGRVAAFVDAAPVVARYSSRGPDVVDRLSTPADVLKPDILAPGDQIWAAWSALSTKEPILAGERFAMISGTSMAAPHVGGVAALIRQRHPSWGPSAVASALSTTARGHDNRGSPIMSEGVELGALHRATPFDYGAGFINPTGALDPGLVVAPDYDDYISFLCSLPQLNPDDVRAATGEPCSTPLGSPADLNLPSITVSALRGTLSVRRTVTNVASSAETYLCGARPPEGVAVSVQPGGSRSVPARRRRW
ncbi:hypothetical protein GUJ93_ZPchr0004g40337 [Zizania palustris]|uniref:Uncharacterized protein n=1 Tax=Zizania palustris TaxID=103762 RepID=A0A8J5SA26_ZIZPA|nr:hypothetical protein GUJ93_ZPchr0004g40337 [Zizania palustris]